MDGNVMPAIYNSSTSNGATTITAVSGPRPWPTLDRKEKWHLEELPDGERRVWLSNKGRVLWNPPGQEAMVTSEGRRYPEATEGVERLDE